jgi:hypothetical protein
VKLSLLTDQPEFPCGTGQSEHQEQNIITKAAKESLGIGIVTVSKLPQPSTASNPSMTIYCIRPIVKI